LSHFFWHASCKKGKHEARQKKVAIVRTKLSWHILCEKKHNTRQDNTTHISNLLTSGIYFFHARASPVGRSARS
jgi:hypothetical protein